MRVGYSLRRDELSRSIQESVKRYIIDHHLKPGDAMPAESELSRQLGISRASLREGMKVLQTMGIIETRHGSGTFVGTYTLDTLRDGLAFRIKVEQEQGVPVTQDMLDLLDLRETLESALVIRLPDIVTDDQIAHLRTLCDQMDIAAKNGNAYKLVDWRFHKALYEPFGNRFTLQFIEALFGVFQEVREEEAPRERLIEIARQHREIVDALAKGDGPAAAEALHRHFGGILDAVHQRNDADGGISDETHLAST
jgi:DNA-binding FadR family transcriptional regulator